MVEVREAGTMELEKLRELVNHELRQREMKSEIEKDWRSPTLAGNGAAMRGEDAGRPMATSGANAVPRGLTLDNVDDAFQYHPWHPFQKDRGDQVRDALVNAAKVILRTVPDGPDRSAALRKLREVRMDANSAITHNGRF